MSITKFPYDPRHRGSLFLVFQHHGHTYTSRNSLPQCFDDVRYLIDREANHQQSVLRLMDQLTQRLVGAP